MKKLFLFTILAASLAACSKEKQGDVIIYTATDDGCGYIRVEVDGFYKGTIKHVMLEEPECGDPGGVNATLDPGNHALHAICEDGSVWNNNFPVKANACTVFELR